MRSVVGDHLLGSERITVEQQSHHVDVDVEAGDTRVGR
jgi:hypothetical protein